MSTFEFKPNADDLRKELIKERNKRFKVEERIKQVQAEIQRLKSNKGVKNQSTIDNINKNDSNNDELNIYLRDEDDDNNEPLFSNENKLLTESSNNDSKNASKDNSFKGINNPDLLLKVNNELKENIEKINASYKELSYNYCKLSEVNSDLIKQIEALSQIIEELKAQLRVKNEMIKSLLLEKKESLKKNDRYYYILEEKITLLNQLDEREHFCEEKKNQTLELEHENIELEERIKDAEAKLNELDISMNKMAYELYDMKKQIMHDYTHEFNVHIIDNSSKKEECTIGIKKIGKHKILHVGASDKIFRYSDDKVKSVEPLDSPNQFIVKYENGSYDTFESNQRDEIIECLKKQLL